MTFPATHAAAMIEPYLIKCLYAWKVLAGTLSFVDFHMIAHNHQHEFAHFNEKKYHNRIYHLISMEQCWAHDWNSRPFDFDFLHFPRARAQFSDPLLKTMVQHLESVCKSFSGRIIQIDDRSKL